MDAIGWLRFQVGGLSYGLPLEALAEVTRASRLRVIPRVPLEVAGVVNFRGEPLPTVDGGVVLLRRPSRQHRHLLVLSRESLRLGMLVDQVLRIDRALPVLRPTEVVAGPELAFVAWHNEGDSALGVVHPEGLIERATELLTEQRAEGEPNSCHNAF